ncbi:MAG: ATP-grasp domain-containing protein [Planctomycetes bacterium]|nr:ATP-grasp domain-containing protein [Planctomycetota bacterium]
MGEGTGRRVVKVAGNGPLSVLLKEEIRRKGLPVDLLIEEAPEAPAFAPGISVVVVRDAAGDLRAYPVAEQIPEMTIVPARLDAAAAAAAGKAALSAVPADAGPGIFCVGMTVGADGAVLIREVASGLHLAGRYTIEACRTSQFEQYLRVRGALPAGETTLLYAAVTVDLLGAPAVQGPCIFEGIEAVRSIPGASVHLYGEKETAPGRLLGHLTLVGVDDPAYRDALVHRADHVRRMIVQKEARR